MTIHPKGRTIATVDRDGLFIRRMISKIVIYKKRSSRRRTCSRFFIKFSLYTQSFCVPLVSNCSQLISAPFECVNFNFDRKKWKKSSLELQTSSSEIQNEKPCIWRLIGSFRRLIWVRLFVFILRFHHLVLILHFES